MLAVYYLIEIFTMRLVAIHILNFKQEQKTQRIILINGIIIVMLLGIDYLLLNQIPIFLTPNTRILITVPIAIISMMYSLRSFKISMLITLGVIYFYNSVITMATAVPLFAILGVEIEMIINSNVYASLGSLGGLVVLALVYLSTKMFKLKLHINRLEFKEKILLMFLVVMFSVFLSTFLLLVSQMEFELMDQFLNLMAVIGVITMIYIVLFLISKNQELTESKHNEQQLEARMMEQYLYYSELQRANEETKNFRHDVKIKLVIIAKMIKDGNAKHALKSIEELTGEIVEIQNLIGITTGSDLINIILRALSSQYSDTEITWDGLFPHTTILSNKETISLFYNVLKNAYEACEKVTHDKYVRVVIEKSQKNLIIKVVNSYNGNLEIANDRFLTTKTDKHKHGLGLGIIKRIVEETHGGRVKFAHNESEFTTLVTFGKRIYKTNNDVK